MEDNDDINVEVYVNNYRNAIVFSFLRCDEGDESSNSGGESNSNKRSF